MPKVKKPSISSLLPGLAAAIETARNDKWNLTAISSHACQICGPDVWHGKGDVRLGICDAHFEEIKKLASVKS